MESNVQLFSEIEEASTDSEMGRLQISQTCGLDVSSSGCFSTFCEGSIVGEVWVDIEAPLDGSEVLSPGRTNLR